MVTEVKVKDITKNLWCIMENPIGNYNFTVEKINEELKLYDEEYPKTRLTPINLCFLEKIIIFIYQLFVLGRFCKNEERCLNSYLPCFLPLYKAVVVMLNIAILTSVHWVTPGWY